MLLSVEVNRTLHRVRSTLGGTPHSEEIHFVASKPEYSRLLHLPRLYCQFWLWIRQLKDIMYILNRVKLVLVMMLLLTAVLIMGCGRAVNRAAERRIRDALPNVIGPAREYRVHVTGSVEDTLGGHLSDVAVDGVDVLLPGSLRLDTLHLDLQGVEISGKKVTRVRQARFTATMGEASIDEYLAGEAPEDEPLRGTRVTLADNNLVTITSERVVLGVGIPFHMTGPLRLNGGQLVELDAARLVVAGIPISGRPLNFLKRRFETAADLSTLAFPIHLTSIQSVRGKLIIAGNADVSEILRQNQGE